MVPALIQPRSMDELSKLASVFRKSGYFKGLVDEAQAVTKILYGMELGFSPIVSMMSIYIVDGKPSLSGNLIGALIKKSGRYNFRVREMTDSACSIEFFENGESIGTSAFTKIDANAAGLLGKDSWKRYPKAMLYNRALSAGARAFCPDVTTSPIYVPEEIGAEVTEEGEVVSIPETISPVAETITLTPVKLPEQQNVGGHVGSHLEPESRPVEAANEDTSASAASAPFEYISIHQKSNLARRFRESLRESIQHEANELRHAALTALHQTGRFKSKLMDDNGNPTSEFILVEEYAEIGKELIRGAKAL